MMQAGAVTSADSSSFADSLELARHVQQVLVPLQQASRFALMPCVFSGNLMITRHPLQDAQEFFSLLLGNLEPKLKLSSDEVSPLTAHGV